MVFNVRGFVIIIQYVPKQNSLSEGHKIASKSFSKLISEEDILSTMFSSSAMFCYLKSELVGWIFL